MHARRPTTPTRLVRAQRGRALFVGTWLAAQAAGRLSERLARPFAERLWFTPWTSPTTAASRSREAAWLAATERVALPVDGRTLTGFTAGEGPAVLLVHGWGDHAARLAAFVEPLVAAGFRVVGVDLPGHGASRGGPTDLYALASVVRGVAERVGAAGVVAHSLGGAMTVLALRDGLALQAVTLVAPAVRIEQGVHTFAARLRLPARAVSGLRRGVERRFGAGVWEDLRADVAAASLRIPALVIHDRGDTHVPAADGGSLAGAWPGAQLRLTDGLGHSRILRDADVTRQAAEFLRAVILPAPLPAAAQPG